MHQQYISEVESFVKLCSCATSLVGPSAPPQHLLGHAVDAHSVLLSWDPPPLEHQNGVIRHYFLNISAPALNDYRTEVSTLNSITIHNLRPFTTYYFSVAAATTIANGPFSVSVEVQTPEDGKVIWNIG